MSRFIWADQARIDLRKIDRDRAHEILLALTDYARTGAGDVRRLMGSTDWRLRVGDYRVRFEILPDDLLRILHVKHRREAYR